MKRRIALTIALFAAVLSLSLLSSDSTARAQKPNRYRWDTGVVTLGPNQILRLTAVNRGKADSTGRFAKMEYSQGTCNGGVCIHTLVSEIPFGGNTLAPGEAASIDIANTSFGVRGMVLSNSPDVQVTGMIIDTDTGRVVGLIMREDEVL